MDVDVQLGAPSQVGRVAAVSEDRMRMWIEFTSGAVATADSAGGPIDIPVGTVVLVRDDEDFVGVAPPEVWPTDNDKETQPGGRLWVGVVRFRDDHVTLVDKGNHFYTVPTNVSIDYAVGNTVEGTDSTGVTRVLDQAPLRFHEPPDVGEEVIQSFLVEPSESLGFDDFGGLPEVVRRARELIELPLERRDALIKIGADPIKGVLFTGPPGTGKTMLASIIASVASAKFYAISGPTVFSKWYGESEGILRRIFAHAATNAPAIIFFDEIDSVAGQRSEEAHEASKRVVAQLLTLMDGLGADANVTVIAATNRPQDIDIALRRPGRFDWQIDFPLPNPADREAILKVGARKLTTEDALPHVWVAANTAGWSAAELAAIWKEASLLAVADDREIIMIEDYLGGHERVAEQRRRVALASQRTAP
jgi:transitional endoplasmic reticulum ATPase